MKKTAKLGYTLNHEDKEIVLTKAFMKQASIPGTKEFRTLADLRKVYSDYTITMRTAIVSDKKEKHNGLTRERMEKYMATLDNAEEALAEYQRFLAYYGVQVESKKEPGKMIWKVSYGKLKGWFLKKYPNYADVSFENADSDNEENDKG